MEKTTSRSNSPATLGSKSISELLVQYSVPAIIAYVATSLYNIIDSIFIGRGVGAMAISGLAITFPFMNLCVAFCTLIAVGGATISSIFLGQKNYARATSVINNVALQCLVLSIVVGGVSLYFIDEILYFFGATSETVPYAREFMTVILYGLPVSYVFIGLNNLMRATGYPKKAMISALLSVAVNLILAPIFIFKLKWGISGVALATVIGQGVAFVWVLFHFLSKKSFIHLDIHNRWFTPNILRKVYTIGMSPFLMNVTACVVVVFLNRALLDVGGADGNIAVGAYGILNRTTMFFVMIVFGVTQGMQPILGYNYGAGKWPRVKRTLWYGIWAGLIITVIGFVVTEVFPDYISQLFTTDARMIEIARDGFHIYFLFFPLVGCQIVIQNFFQSIGKPGLSIFLSLTRQLIFLLPFLMILPMHFGIDGVWASVCGSDLLAFLLAAVTLWVMMYKHKKEYSDTRN